MEIDLTEEKGGETHVSGITFFLFVTFTDPLHLPIVLLQQVTQEVQR